MDYNNEEDYDEYLPKRSDAIYQEIESFEEYELTQCVAYEMAIRNEEVKKLFVIAGLNKTLNVENYLDAILIKNDETKKIDAIKKLSSYGFNYSQCAIYSTKMEIHEKNNPNNLLLGSAGVLYTPENIKIKDILNKNELDEVCKIEIEEYNKESWVKHPLKNNDEILSIFYNLEYPFSEKSNKIIKDALKRNHKISIENDFSRPTLILRYTPIANININLALPNNELLEYIKLLKEKYMTFYVDFDEETKKGTIRPNTPLELLGEKLQYETLSEKLPKKPDAKKYADMFFIYDYVTARHREVKQHNEKQKKIYEAELLEIKNNTYLSIKERRDLKKDEFIHYQIVRERATPRDICHEERLTEQLDIKGERIYDYYRVMKPYIEELKYKELITGLQAE
jgi:hypothetical protein